MSNQIEVTELYGGAVRLEFNPKSHRYKIYDGEDIVSAPSVTTVCGVLDKSGPLVYWAVNEALKVVAQAIQPNESYSEIFLEQVLAQAKKAHREVKQEAADIGTMAHQWLEQYFRVGPPPMPEHPAVLNCVNAALAWLAEHHVEPVANERRIYSRKYKFSGTADMIANVDGVLTLLDWKSSKSCYPEFRLQTAAYVAAYEEETGEYLQGRTLVRLGKEDGEFDPKSYTRAQYRQDWKAFRAALELHQFLKSIK